MKQKTNAFTLAEILIVLVIIGVLTMILLPMGVLTMILLPMAFQSSPDEKAMKFKKGYNTLGTVIRELVSSDRYYQNGDLGTRANGVLVDRTHDGDFTYFCETFADVISTKSVNCSEGVLNNYGSFQIGETDSKVTEEGRNEKKSQVDSICALEEVQKNYGNSIVTTDGIHFYESGPERTFGSNSSAWNAEEGKPADETRTTRTFAGPNDTPYFKDINGFDISYKYFCMDIDGPNTGEAPFGFGIRADGKILNGARADEWLKKSIQKGNE